MYNVSIHEKLSDKKELTPSGVCVLNKLNNNTLPGFVEKNVCKVQKNNTGNRTRVIMLRIL